jgi:hypothetical protein
VKEHPLPFDPKPILEAILHRCGSLHPVARRSLVGEGRRLWQSFGIVELIRPSKTTSVELGLALFLNVSVVVTGEIGNVG